MKSKLLARIPWMGCLAGMATLAAGQDLPQPAEVYYGHAGLLKAPAWQVGNECYVAVPDTKGWGWTVSLSRFEAKVDADGRTVRVPFRIQAGKEVLPVGQVARLLGANTGWKPGTGKFEVWSTLSAVKVHPETVSIDAPFPVKVKLAELSNPPRAVADVYGARLENFTEVVLPANARISQLKSDVVRITVESERAFAKDHELEKPIRGFDLKFGGTISRTAPEELPLPAGQEPPIPPITNIPEPPESLPFDTQPTIGANPPSLSGPVQVQAQGPLVSILRIPLTKPLMSPPQIGRTLPHVLRVRLPGSKYIVSEDLPGYSGIVKEVTYQNLPGVAEVEITLERPMGLEVSYSANEIRLMLIKPKVGDGKLAGKTVVVDAGHGGHDSGARSPDKSTTEKSLTLKIATKLASTLAHEGATVIMTRKTDVFIPLRERAEIANRNEADFFISVHINSNRAANSSTGQISFHHKQDPIGMLLAECIQREMAKVSGLKSIGVWSDQRIYQGGFAVLRYAQMPAVLLEMGFINTTKDRARMTSASFPDDMSQAILRGLRIFLGDVKAKD